MPFGVLSGIQNVIIHAKFHVDRLRGLWAAGPPKVPFPILIGTTLTTVLHYRADCDIMCTNKFGVDSSSRFPFKARTNALTDRQTHLNALYPRRRLCRRG